VPLRWLVALVAALIAAAAVAALLLQQRQRRPSGVGQRTFYVRLLYEGCRGNFALYTDPLMRRNFFRRGELAAFEFEVSNPGEGELRVELHLAPLDDPQRGLRVGEAVAKPGVSRLSFEVDTSRLEPALYLVTLRVEGVGDFSSNTEPFRSTNLQSYPWLLAVLEGPVEWPAEAGGLPRLVVPEGLGVNIHFARPSPIELRDLDMIAYAGFKLVRMDLFWESVERERGVYDFSSYDALTEALRERGIRPLYILDYGNRLYGEGPPRSEEARGAFARYAAAAASRYRGYPLWEIWNEPNIEVFWRPQPSVRDYARLAVAAAEAIKGVCPECVVLAPATSGVDVAFVREAAALGLLERMDAVSVHPYRGEAPETALDDYRRLREVVGGKAVVCSEWGYTTGGRYANRVDVVTQAQYAVRIYLTNLMASVPITILYDWKDDGLSLDDSEQNFGLVSHHVQGPEWFFVKPAYYAIYNLNRELAGFAPAGTLSLGEGVYALAFEREGRRKIVVWTRGPPVEVTIEIGASGAEVVRLFGLRERVEAPNGTLKLVASGSPLILTPRP